TTSPRASRRSRSPESGTARVYGFPTLVGILVASTHSSGVPGRTSASVDAPSDRPDSDRMTTRRHPSLLVVHPLLGPFRHMANSRHVEIVKRGADSIARWRRRNPLERLDLF